MRSHPGKKSTEYIFFNNIDNAKSINIKEVLCLVSQVKFDIKHKFVPSTVARSGTLALDLVPRKIFSSPVRVVENRICLVLASSQDVGL